jgi:hypothetical protein
VRRNENPATRAVASLLTLALSLTLAAPARSASPVRPQTLAAAAQARVASLDVAKATSPDAQAPTPAPAEGGTNRSFFATPKGIATTLLLAGLIGYTVHSRITGAVHSPARQ